MTRLTLKTLSATVALLLLLPLIYFGGAMNASAEENNKWIYIDGENITREVNTAIAYFGVETTEQTLWGHDIVISPDGTVTNIVEGGLSEGENLKVPEGGTVISAAGVKVQWFKDNVRIGTRLFYDRYNQKLFICDGSLNFDPYFVKTVNVEGENGNYLITNPTLKGAITYTFDIAVDASGTVIYRGSNATLPEGGFIISAASKSDMETLMCYAPVGAGCTVSEGVATFTYNQTMLKRTAETELINAQTLIYNAKMAYDDIDFAPLDTAAAELVEAIATANDYRSIIDIVERIRTEITDVCHSAEPSELRGAFHTPKERDINEVRETVKRAKAAGLNTLFLKVTNGYGTIVSLPSDDRFGQDPYFGGFDVLKAYTDVCDEENIALVLSIDVYYNEYASIAAPEWMSKTNGDEEGVSFKYYSPASDEFIEYFTEYVKYIVTEYEINTVMLDHLRYPKFSEECDYGYDDKSLSEFSDLYGIPLSEAEALGELLFESPHWEKWVEYRVSLVSKMAKSVSDAVREARSDVTLLAVAARDTVDYFYMQETVKWIEEDIFDGLTLELYESDRDENDPIDELGYYDGFVTEKGALIGAYTGNEKHFFVALDMSIGCEPLASAVKESRDIGAGGCIFGSIDEFISLQRSTELKNRILGGDAVSPLQDTVYAMKMILEFAKTKISDRILPYGGCDDATATQALLKINEAMMTLSDGAMTYDEASALTADMAMLFASSSAKHSVVKDFETVEKLALLHKIKKATLPPDVSDPFGDESEPDESADVSDTEESGGDTESTDDESVNEESVPTVTPGIGIGIGEILVYAFVGATLIAALVALIVGIRRKNVRPKNSHMPKIANKDGNGHEE